MIPLDMSFDYDGPMGTTKTHYLSGHCDPVSNCCESEVYENLEVIEQ